MFKARVLTPWNTDAGQYPQLEEMLQPGDSIMDVTGQPVPNIVPDPNSATWERWCNDYSTIEGVAGDGRFYILEEWETEGEEEARGT
jgi:hypothetical protein